MRIILLLIAIAFAADAYFASGFYTKAAVHGISNQVQTLTGTSASNKREGPRRTETPQQSGQSEPATGGLK